MRDEKVRSAGVEHGLHSVGNGIQTAAALRQCSGCERFSVNTCGKCGAAGECRCQPRRPLCKRDGEILPDEALENLLTYVCWMRPFILSWLLQVGEEQPLLSFAASRVFLPIAW